MKQQQQQTFIVTTNNTTASKHNMTIALYTTMVADGKE